MIFHRERFGAAILPIPAIVLEFISETEGGEYSINPHYPYGKWYFYERILQVPVYGIFLYPFQLPVKA
jgi:hypothetical protein